jgi:hypothetical protein
MVWGLDGGRYEEVNGDRAGGGEEEQSGRGTGGSRFK